MNHSSARSISIAFCAAVILILLAALPCAGWEFSMKGEFEYRFNYMSRLGDKDLFGYAPAQDLADGAFVGFAGPNIYGSGYSSPFVADSAGAASGGNYRITRGGFSRFGSEAWANDMRLRFFPVFQVNRAIRVYGVYSIGGVRHKYFQGVDYDGGPLSGPGVPPLESYYTSRTSMNAGDTAAFGSWEQIRASFQLPMGIISIGVKDFSFGMGATLGQNTRGDSLLLIVPYGPLRAMWALWLGRGLVESYGTVPDGDIKNSISQAALFTFDYGCVSLGGAVMYEKAHTPPGLSNVGNAAVAAVGNLDQSSLVNLYFLKFNNGVWFANGEIAWANIDRTPTVNPAVFASNIARETHVEAFHWFTEAGAVLGPAKLAAVAAVSSGRTLNNDNPTKVYASMPINYQALQSYQHLMFDLYGGGNSGGWNADDVAFSSDEHGMMADAFCLGGRIDYALAANLNVWGSYLWAQRWERAGYLIGQFNETGSVTPPGSGPGSFGAAIGFPERSPFVQESFIGWEADAGVNWRLLEGLILDARYALWQPGGWFDWAYQAITPADGSLVRNGLMKDRDPIQAVGGSLIIEF